MQELIEIIKQIDTENDVTSLLKMGRKCKKHLKERGLYDIKIAILGSCSIQFISNAVRTILFRENVRADIYEGEYNGIDMAILDKESSFYRFQPDIVIILPDYRDIKVIPDLFESNEGVDEWVSKQVEKYEVWWALIENQLPDAKIIQGNFVEPYERVLGNLEVNYYFSKANYYKLINAELIRRKKKNVTLLDLEYWACWYGKKNWFDDTAYVLNKSSLSLNYVGRVAEIIVSQILGIKGRVKKCLVLDLDNTLWGGVVADEGYDGIQLDPNNAMGEAFLNFQRYVLDLKARGVILAVCSKNDERIAKEPFEKNRDMLIKLDDIACFVANWNDKASNMELISRELNIGIDSLVFFDDNPAEREIVKQFQKDVYVVDVPTDPALYVRQLVVENPFEWIQLTNEDIGRSQSYVSNRKRLEIMDNCTDYNEYLNMLQMTGNVQEIEDSDVERFVQLINKSNQFNLRTQRYSDTEVYEKMQDPNIKLLKVCLEDKFSNYGIISCLIVEKRGEVCWIDTWLMSCRVLKRGVEHYAFKKVICIAKEWGCNCIYGEYIPTPKNEMVKDFYQNLGFEVVGENQFTFDLHNEFKKEIFIKER